MPQITPDYVHLVVNNWGLTPIVHRWITPIGFGNFCESKRKVDEILDRGTLVVMRVRLSLRPIGYRTVIPINYQHGVSSAIYSVLSAYSPEYARFLHDRGYISGDGKPLKLFVFSKLFIPRVEQDGNTLILLDDQPVKLLVSSPMIDEFVQTFVLGLFEKQEFIIANRYACGRFRVEKVETLSVPEVLADTSKAEIEVKFKCLSPIVVSTRIEDDGGGGVYYLRSDDPALAEKIRQNLIRKLALTRKLESDMKLDTGLDNEYIARMGGHEKISKLVTIAEGEGYRETRVKGFVCPLTLRGSRDLITVAYECGIGNKNSMGFGMLEVV